MKANADKFQAIAIGPKTNKHNLSFDLKGNKITCDENVFFHFKVSLPQLTATLIY